MPDKPSIQIVNQVPESKVADLRYNSETQELEVFIEQGVPCKTIILSGKDPTLGTKITFASGASLNFLTTAITENSTTTTLAAGSIGFTTHATGRGKIFYSDGSKWQLVTAVAA